MTASKIATAALAVVVPLLLFSLFNIYYLKPMMEHELTTTKPLPPRVPVPDPSSRNIRATTLEKIRMINSRNEPLKPVTTGLDRSSPFFWPGERLKMDAEQVDRLVVEEPRVVPRKPAPKPRRKPVLGMILIGENSKTALLNNELVQEGDRLGAFTVLKIRKNEVRLKDRRGEFILSLTDS